jgi:hypothetical protein
VGYTGSYCGVSIDNGQTFYGGLATAGTTTAVAWHIDSTYISAGKHTLHFMSGFQSSHTGMGLEIYDNTPQELINEDDNGSGVNIIFSTAGLRNKIDVKSFFGVINHSPSAYHYTYYFSNGSKNTSVPCDLDAIFNPPPPINVNNIRNPYISGFMGNWRPYQTKVFQQKRDYTQITANQYGVNVKNAGYIDKFSPYWYYTSGVWLTDTLGNRKRWVNANTVTLYDKYGQQLENKDALNRYSAARFDFNGELPSAVASNAMNRDIYASSFEDVKFKALHNAADSTVEFTQPSGAGLSSFLSSAVSHTGNYSLLIPSTGITLSTNVYTLAQKTQAYLDRDGSGQYITKSVTGLYPKGFEPNPNKQYIFNAWVKDSAPLSKSIPIVLTAKGSSGSAIPVNLTCKAIVEGWKLVEGTINMAALSSPSALTLNITGNGIYIDDIRIHPFDAHLKTYAYDDATLRLMAELDENCFATFYEYDDEGLLIRVKKETERGIMTLKETRSSYKKQP